MRSAEAYARAGWTPTECACPGCRAATPSGGTDAGTRHGRAWAKLERAYEQAGETYDRAAQREIGERIERFAKELKRDLQLNSLLRQRGQQHSLTECSRLARWCVDRRHRLEKASRTMERLRQGHAMSQQQAARQEATTGSCSDRTHRRQVRWRVVAAANAWVGRSCQ